MARHACDRKTGNALFVSPSPLYKLRRNRARSRHKRVIAKQKKICYGIV